MWRYSILNTDTPSSLKITTNKKTYNIGEAVIFTVQNNGEQTLAFSDSNLSLRIQNNGTDETFPLAGEDVITTIDSGQSKVIEWNPLKKGSQVPAGPGEYSASVTSIEFHGSRVLSAKTTFNIFVIDPPPPMQL